jgi:hypothetical protein
MNTNNSTNVEDDPYTAMAVAMARHMKTLLQQLDDDPYRKDRVKIIETICNLPCHYFPGHPSDGTPSPQHDGEKGVIQWAVDLAKSCYHDILDSDYSFKNLDKFDGALGQKQPPSQESIMNADAVAVRDPLGCALAVHNALGQKQPPSQERFMNADAVAVRDAFGQKQPPSHEKDTRLSAKKVADTTRQQQTKIKQFLKELPPLRLAERNVDDVKYHQIVRLKSKGVGQIFPFDEETFKKLKDGLQIQIDKQTNNVDKDPNFKVDYEGAQVNQDQLNQSQLSSKIIQSKISDYKIILEESTQSKDMCTQNSEWLLAGRWGIVKEAAGWLLEKVIEAEIEKDRQKETSAQNSNVINVDEITTVAPTTDGVQVEEEKSDDAPLNPNPFQGGKSSERSRKRVLSYNLVC